MPTWGNSDQHVILMTQTISQGTPALTSDGAQDIVLSHVGGTQSHCVDMCVCVCGWAIENNNVCGNTQTISC